MRKYMNGVIPIDVAPGEQELRSETMSCEKRGNDGVTSADYSTEETSPTGQARNQFNPFRNFRFEQVE